MLNPKSTRIVSGTKHTAEFRDAHFLLPIVNTKITLQSKAARMVPIIEHNKIVQGEY